MKKALILAAALSMAMSFSTYSDTVVSAGTEAAQETTQEVAPLFDLTAQKCHVKYTGFAIKQDYDGKDCLVIYMDATNLSGKSSFANQGAFIKAFQNGVELENGFILEDEACNNSVKYVQNGVTLNIAEAFVLKDRSDVDIEIEDLWNWTESTTQKATIKLQ